MLQDASFAMRMMRKSALATATIIICLGLSMGSTATVVAWMDGLVFRSVRGVPEIDRLVTLQSTTATSKGGLSYPAFRDVRDAENAAGSRLFEGIAASSIRRFNLRTAQDDERHAEPIWGLLASANYFEVLRVRPALGRGFLPGDDSVANREPVAVISDAMWRRRFSADAGVLGQSIWINGREMTVIGVTPPDFKGTIAGLAFDVWMPVTMHPALPVSPTIMDDRNIRWLSVFGRLAPGKTLEMARAQARVLGTRLAAANELDRERGMTARTLDVGPTEMLKPLFAIMLGTTLLVLLIVCTNVANLLMLRGAAREHELAVRLALGAKRPRLVRQLMTESLLLAIGGIVLGLLMAQVTQSSFGRFFPDTPLPVSVDTSLNVRLVAGMTVVGILTVFIFGLAPALRTTRGAERISLTGGSRGTTAARGRIRGLLVGAQFALSLTVLVCAGIFLGRLDELSGIDRGFRAPEQVMLATLDFELAGVHDQGERNHLVERVLERVRSIPGVTNASAASFVPLGFLGYSRRDARVEGYVPRPGESMNFLINRVHSNYFETLGVPILKGRGIEATDRSDALPVIVVNSAFANQFWPDGDPVGRRLEIDGKLLTVVGVAGDGKYEFSTPLDEPSPPFLYIPMAQSSVSYLVLHVRTRNEPLLLLPAVRREVSGVDSRIPVLSPTTLDSYSNVPLFPVQIGSQVLSMLGSAALVLAALGLYAVIGYAVVQRQREIGVRMALGATSRRLVTGFLAEAARFAGIGAAAGLLLSFLMIKAIEHNLIYLMPKAAGGVATPFVIALVALTSVALIAALIPAQRVTRVNPTTALRAD
jgi:predicted permease